MWQVKFSQASKFFSLKWEREKSVLCVRRRSEDSSVLTIIPKKKLHGGIWGQKLARLQEGEVLGGMLWANCASLRGRSYSSPSSISIMRFTPCFYLSFSFPHSLVDAARKWREKFFVSFIRNFYFCKYWWRSYWSYCHLNPYQNTDIFKTFVLILIQNVGQSERW